MFSLRASIRTNPELQRMFRDLSKQGIARVFRRTLIQSGKTTLLDVRKQIIPRSGKRLPDAKANPPDSLRITSRSGSLRGSLVVDASPLPAAIQIGSPLVYAPVHEFGRGIKARPFLAPGLDESEPGIEEILARELRKVAGVK